MTCQWLPHSLTALAQHLEMFDLAEEPNVNIHWEDDLLFSIRDDTTISIDWKHPDKLVVKAELIGSGIHFDAEIRRRGRKYEISGLSQHVNLWLECGGRRFARIEWYWTNGRPLEDPFHEVFDVPLLSHPQSLRVEPKESESRLRNLFAESDSGAEDWIHRRPQAASGLTRALLLKRLGAEVRISAALVEELAVGAFHSHLPKYWTEMAAMIDYLEHPYDWGWAAKHLLPPTRSATSTVG